MKNVLFIGVTKYNLKEDLHLRKKFEGLARELNVFVLAKGNLSHQRIWGTEFYLLPPGFFWTLAFPLAFYLCLAKKIDVIVCQSPLLEGFLGTILKKLLKKELIVEIHGDWFEGPFLSKKRKLEFLERKIVPVLAKISLRNADKIRAVANYLITQAKKIAPDKPYFVFPTFTDLDGFLKEKDINFDNFILFVGQLEKVKGVDTLIEAFYKLNFQFSIFNFQLLIIGDGSEKQNLKSQISNLKIENKVEFRGRLSLEEVKNKMKSCYCLVLPSLSEGLPRVIMEAMALGKPVIASNVGGIPELIKDGQNGFLIEPKNSDQLAEKLKILLSNKALAVKLGQNGREFVRNNFSNQKYIKNYLSIIKK